MAKRPNRFARFCFRHRNKGIPNLMLYISIGSAIVYLISMFAGNNVLYDWLCFDRALILQGQVWRLFTFALTYSAGNILFTAITLLCYFSLGRAMESAWGTFRFNLFYFTGILLTDAFCMIFGNHPLVPFLGLEANLIFYLNMSLFIGFATMHPDAHFMLFFFIPVRAWIFALIDLALTVYEVVSLTRLGLFPYSLLPLVALGNYFLFFGKDVVNVLPLSFRLWLQGLFGKKRKPAPKTVPFRPQNTAASRQQPSYNHRCTVCGRTDVSHPNLEFRYCSRCKGYFCYCEDHISNHTHVQ